MNLSNRNYPQLVFADEAGKIFNYPLLEGLGRKGKGFFRLKPGDLIPLPVSSELFKLPDRFPVGLNPNTGKRVILKHDPFSKSTQRCFAVAAFVSPGHTLTHHCAYEENDAASPLPLFSYGACVFYKEQFYVAALCVDKDSRHDSRFFNAGELERKVRNLQKTFKGNRLFSQLKICAFKNQCPNAKNFFLSRFEAPLPVSPHCNASCHGCISFQKKSDISCTQERLDFVPTCEEIFQIAFHHINNSNEGLVSFGQGCEGEPLLQADVIENAIRLIRQKTTRGIIHMNTNGSRPGIIERLFDVGLDSIRVSLNSAQEVYYNRYYRPHGYSFRDVMRTLDLAKKMKHYVSLNYLAMPGFTDWVEEVKDFRKLLKDHPVNMVQWRNLNYDPLYYFRMIGFPSEKRSTSGIAKMIYSLKKSFPSIRHGYFNPYQV